jgi:hypothetical protein
MYICSLFVYFLGLCLSITSLPVTNTTQESWLCSFVSQKFCQLDTWIDKHIPFGPFYYQSFSDILKNGFTRFEQSLIQKAENGSLLLEKVVQEKLPRLAHVMFVFFSITIILIMLMYI